MAFSTTMPVGGVLDEVKKLPKLEIAAIDNLGLPEHVFPTLTKRWAKGFKIDVPAAPGIFSQSFTVPMTMEFFDISVACSGYGDDDFWELDVGGEKMFETFYTKELPQHVNAGTAMGNAQKLPAGTVITMNFHNNSGSSKKVWFDLTFFK